MSMAEQISEVNTIIHSLNELQDDATVPRNVRTKVQIVITALKENTELQIKISRALSELDELANDVNLQSYTRTQLWNIISLLEKFN